MSLLIKHVFVLHAHHRKGSSMANSKNTREKQRKRKIALRKAEQFKAYALDYLKAKKDVPTGFQLADQFRVHKNKIKKVLGASEKDWRSWKWQLHNRISDAATLKKSFPSLIRRSKNLTRSIPDSAGPSRLTWPA